MQRRTVNKIKVHDHLVEVVAFDGFVPQELFLRIIQIVDSAVPRVVCDLIKSGSVFDPQDQEDRRSQS